MTMTLFPWPHRRKLRNPPAPKPPRLCDCGDFCLPRHKTCGKQECVRKRKAQWANGCYAREAPVRRKAEIVERKCLKCDRPFASEGPWNRMCPSCRERAAGVDESAVGVSCG